MKINFNIGETLFSFNLPNEERKSEEVAKKIARHLIENHPDETRGKIKITLTEVTPDTVSYQIKSEPNSSIVSIALSKLGIKTTDQTDLFYWSGVLANPDELDDETSAVIHKLSQGDYKGADLDLKRSKTHRIYSAKINHSDRLLFTTIERDGRRYLFLLERIYNHDYQKSKFLKSPRILDQYILKWDEAIPEQFEEGDFQPVDETDLPEYEQGTIPTPLLFYNFQFLKFDTEQNKAASCKPPFLISGTAGSGKTCLALQGLEQLQAKHVALGIEKKILYITSSDDLVRTMKNNWRVQNPEHDEESPVQFYSYDQLLKILDPTLVGKRQIDPQQFRNWLKAYRDTWKKIHNHVTPPRCLENYKEVTEELRLLSGHRKESYLKLGKRHTGFHGQDKTVIYEAYLAYLEYLSQHPTLYDIPFHQVPVNEAPYHFIWVDEAQNLSSHQIATLTKLSDSNIGFNHDSRQSVHVSKSTKSYIQNSLFHETELTLQTVHLKKTYRCPPAIAHFANGVLALTDTLSGGKLEKNEYSEIESHIKLDGSSPIWLKYNPEAIKELNALGDSAETALIVSEEYQEEAKKVFPNITLTFTPEEIIGLEYDKIILFRPLDHDIFKKANTKLNEKEVKKGGNRAKKNEQDDTYRLACNGLFTSITRAKKELYIVQDKTHANKNLSEFLDEYLPNQAHEPMSKATVEKKGSGIEEWYNTAQRLLGSRHLKQAKEVILKHLKDNEQMCEKLRAEFQEEMDEIFKKTSKGLSALVSKLLDIKPDQVTNKMISDLCSLKNDPPELLQMIETLEGVEALTNIIINKKDWSKQVAKALKEKESIYCLANSEEGLDLLSILAKENANLIGEKILNLFCTVPPKSDNGLLGIYSIANPEKGITIISEIEKASPKLLNAKFLKALCELPKTDNLKFKPLSGVYLLGKYDDGVDVLSKILNVKGQHYDKAFDALCEICQEDSADDKNTSAIYFLLRSEKGIDLLKTIFDNKPTLIHKRFMRALCAVRPQSAGLYENDSGLYRLSDYEKGVDLLIKIYIENPALFDESFMKALCAVQPEAAGEAENTSGILVRKYNAEVCANCSAA